jgi:serine/threonine protein kinase
VLLAIEHVHKCGYLYRDLKPENMLVKPNGSIRLADFGLSVNVATKKDGKATSICGTSEYMAPEMLTKKGYALNI